MSAAGSAPRFDVEATNNVKEDKLDAFLNSTLESELTSIPLCGPATVTALAAAGINNSVSKNVSSS